MGEIYTGNNISIDNTGNKKAKIKIGGADYQETRSGKNFFNIYDLIKGMGALDIDSEDFVTVTVDNSSGSSSKYYNVYTNPSSKIEKSTKYYLVLEVKEVSGVGSILVHSTSPTDNIPQFEGSKVYSLATLQAGDIKIDEITSIDDLSVAKTMLRTFLAFNAGQSGSITFRISVLEEEPTVESFVYEKYGAMPSPEYPSRVETVGSNINEFDKSASPIYVAGSTATEIENGIRIATISSNQGLFCLYKIKDITNFKGKTFTVKANWIASASNKGRIILGLCDSNGGNRISGADTYVSGEAISYTIPDTLSTSTYLALWLYSNANGTAQTGDYVDYTDIKVEPGDKATAYSPYGIGSVEIDVGNKNWLKLENETFLITGVNVETNNNCIKLNGQTSNSGQVFNGTNNRKYLGNFKKGKYTFSIKESGDINYNNSAIAIYIRTSEKILVSTQLHTTSIIRNGTFELTENTDIYISGYYGSSGISLTNAQILLQIELGETASEIVEHQSQTKIVPIQEEMLEDDYIADVEYHTWGKVILTGNESWAFAEESIQPFRLNLSDSEQLTPSQDIVPNVYCSHFTPVAWNSSKDKLDAWTTALVGTQLAFGYREITTLEDWKAWLQEQYNSGNPVIVYYKLAIPLELELTPEQSNVAYQLENIELFDGINYITATSSIDPELEVTVENPVEDYKIQISSDGHLIIPELNIKYLIDLNESNIPIMPEATESSVRAAGRDGDIVLNTTYEPITFDIVCYTEDNLTYSEKINAEKNMNRFLNSIKNKTIEIAFEKNSSFYKVKYSGALVTTNFPKHLKFAIPLKSSDSYGKGLIQKSIVGNATGESNTIEEVGAVFVIKGPALNPIISLNDYSMEYTTSILEGARVEIDSNKSTITNINNDGVKTNVMKYYNHQFPKIQNGTNTLKILSGIDNDKNVIVMWNDLKL